MNAADSDTLKKILRDLEGKTAVDDMELQDLRARQRSLAQQENATMYAAMECQEKLATSAATLLNQIHTLQPLKSDVQAELSQAMRSINNLKSAIIDRNMKHLRTFGRS